MKLLSLLLLFYYYYCYYYYYYYHIVIIIVDKVKNFLFDEWFKFYEAIL